MNMLSLDLRGPEQQDGAEVAEALECPLLCATGVTASGLSLLSSLPSSFLLPSRPAVIRLTHDRHCARA